MGAVDFFHLSKGKNAGEAFNAAVDQARYDHGHSGYSGTIAEKDGFVLIQVHTVSLGAAQALADKLMSDDDERINNKWGPAGCIPVDDGQYLFFGWASS